MSSALAVLAALCVLPMLLAWLAGYYRWRQLGFDNKHPRQQYPKLTGVGARASAAQQNSWEALAVYGASLLAVVASGAQSATIAPAAALFLALRLSYLAFYLTNLDLLRSATFAASNLVCLYFFYLAFSSL